MNGLYQVHTRSIPGPYQIRIKSVSVPSMSVTGTDQVRINFQFV